MVGNEQGLSSTITLLISEKKTIRKNNNFVDQLISDKMFGSVKCAVLGDGAVGKTCFLIRFGSRQFVNIYQKDKTTRYKFEKLHLNVTIFPRGG